uniref:Uncharacterized protein n=1 Tax=Chromera velia CCMP2878 TaxID=1169474 RepID=A0A0G4HPI8_9ALVE|mmetsp:Transcript_54001/g.105610  ORF Transcript_54001/g.105610 Transcript_54001/m.105610 type:complete len:299 (-) Transcript_54001:367-1263(-)|eukprot:Cvel_7754.t1-p1 / transcript=Cvel_7754.t1 / gene=Cvel_7754 / organism=Chromera_velia_CCMP2878 / gene_product=hypothetical protein / transcript_product=hypothetical protein / location=Cvel_scaffold413:12048-12941(+) / protein_length=298 / sequence_SO=supercontig / SO=protein_coding / is_pseudo=false
MMLKEQRSAQIGDEEVQAGGAGRTESLDEKKGENEEQQGLVECSQCGQKVPKHLFASKQLRKGASTRKCKHCTGAATPAQTTTASPSSCEAPAPISEESREQLSAFLRHVTIGTQSLSFYVAWRRGAPPGTRAVLFLYTPCPRASLFCGYGSDCRDMRRKGKCMHRSMDRQLFMVVGAMHEDARPCPRGLMDASKLLACIPSVHHSALENLSGDFLPVCLVCSPSGKYVPEFLKESLGSVLSVRQSSASGPAEVIDSVVSARMANPPEASEIEAKLLKMSEEFGLAGADVGCLNLDRE